MKKISKKNLDKIISDHQHFLKCDCSDWVEMRADLREVDLHGADLSGVNLHGADLRGADLSWAYLSGADLSDAYLSGADLHEANLSKADLHGADLREANLSRANLLWADLYNADLYGANLSGANLCGANLADANLSNDTVLDNARYDETTAFFKPCCPEEGSFVAFKKATKYHDINQNVIVKLQVPAKARRSSATTRKCRVSEAKVLGITSLDGETSFKKARSQHDESFVYEVGKTVKVKDFETCRWKECAPGIHCFLTREEAVNY